MWTVKHLIICGPFSYKMNKYIVKSFQVLNNIVNYTISTCDVKSKLKHYSQWSNTVTRINILYWNGLKLTRNFLYWGILYFLIKKNQWRKKPEGVQEGYSWQGHCIWFWVQVHQYQPLPHKGNQPHRVSMPSECDQPLCQATPQYP